MTERQKRTAHVSTAEDLARQKRWLGSPPKYVEVPTGRLRLRFEHGWHKLEFEDDKTPLEERLNSIVLSLALKVLEKIRPEAERRAEEEKRHREEEHQRWLFRQKCDRFDAAFRAWRDQQDRLQFVRALEASLLSVDNPSEQVLEFVAWTRRYVEWADPLTKFFNAIEQDETVYYHEYSHRSFG